APWRAVPHHPTLTPGGAIQARPRATVTNGDTGTSTTKFTRVCATSPRPVGKFNQLAMIWGACSPVTQPRLNEPKDTHVPAVNTTPKIASDGVTALTNRRNKLSS